MQFARRLVLIVLAMLGLAMGQARANPMLLVDMDSLQVLYAQDAGAPWHPASLTKLMTAYVTFEAIAAGKVTLDTPVVLSQNAINQAPAKSGLPKDSAMSLKDALYIMLVKSANDVAIAVAETVGGSEDQFVVMMNETAARMGLTASHFVDPNGLHAAGQEMSARDLAVLSLYIRQNFPQYDAMFSTDMVQVDKFSLESNNALLTSFAGTTGMKTGFICASGLNMVVTVERNGHRLLAVVLGGSSARDRNERTAELVLRGLNGELNGTAQNILSVTNNIGTPAVDMRQLICGKGAAAYVKAQEAAFPMGMKGQPSYLNDDVAPRVYQATNLGRVRPNIDLPRPRPMHVAVFPVAVAEPVIAGLDATLRPGLPVAGGSAIPFPRPRPSFLN
ncbi:D-alanyl-D-alanine carboxypeptidase family protein [Devosia sp.]|uniref:D-alanyl-D-alanine carboxypeptidase family protein n=1 Tax=Devosia sp. TaxID=1871048 RepID=UPI0032651FF8